MGIKTLRVDEIETMRWGSRGIITKQNPFQKFRRFIEGSNWDEELLKYEKWINVSCMVVIAVSVVFFFPVALSVFRVW